LHLSLVKLENETFKKHRFFRFWLGIEKYTQPNCLFFNHFWSFCNFKNGDSVALHITYGLDYFCTFDQGKNAGKRSVFGEDICKTLEQMFGFKKLTPIELLERIPIIVDLRIL